MHRILRPQTLHRFPLLRASTPQTLHYLKLLLVFKNLSMYQKLIYYFVLVCENVVTAPNNAHTLLRNNESPNQCPYIANQDESSPIHSHMKISHRRDHQTSPTWCSVTTRDPNQCLYITQSRFQPLEPTPIHHSGWAQPIELIVTIEKGKHYPYNLILNRHIPHQEKKRYTDHPTTLCSMTSISHIWWQPPSPWLPGPSYYDIFRTSKEPTIWLFFSRDTSNTTLKQPFCM